MTRAARRNRLLAEVSAREIDLGRYELHEEQRKRLEAHLSKAKESAEKDLERRPALSKGWNHIYLVDLELLPKLSDADLEARLISLEEECDHKLSGWRKEASRQLAEGANGAARATLQARVAEMMVHIHRRAGNTYYKIDQHSRRVNIVFVLALLIVIGALTANFFGLFSNLSDRIQQDLPLAILSGLFGGVLSVAFRVLESDGSKKIPDSIRDANRTWLRPIIGAALAVPVLLFLESDLLTLGGDQRTWALLAASFLAGFSERWFLGIVQGIERKTGDD